MTKNKFVQFNHYLMPISTDKNLYCSTSPTEYCSPVHCLLHWMEVGRNVDA